MTAAGARRIAWLAGCLGLCIASSASAALTQASFSGVVSRVSDGDTVWVRPDGERRRPVKLRLQGIDAPERCQAWGAQASAALSARVLGQRVVVQGRSRDDHGRLLGDLRLHPGGEDVGAWMVDRGHAWSYRFRHHPGPYAMQEAQARAARRGLFRDPQAEPPRQFRQRHGPCG